MALVPEINLAPQALDAFRRAGVARAALYTASFVRASGPTSGGRPRPASSTSSWARAPPFSFRSRISGS
jgi:hypothetical protein